MKKVSIVLCLILAFSAFSVLAQSTVIHQNLMVVEDITDNRYGIYDLGKVHDILDAYDDTQVNTDNLNVFGVCKNGKWGLIDSDGNVIAEPIYKSIMILPYCVTILNTNDKYGFLDEKGNMMIEPKYDDVTEPFGADGHAIVGYNFGYTAIDKTGREMLPLVQSQIRKTSEHFWFEQDGMSYIMDNRGQEIATLKYKDIYVFNDSRISFETEEKRGVADFQGNIIVDPMYKYINYLHKHDVFVAEVDGKFSYIDSDGNLIGDREWGLPYIMTEPAPVLLIMENGLFGYMDTSGNILMPPIFSETYGLAATLDGKTGIVGADGQYLVEPKWNVRCTDISLGPNGYFHVYKDKKSGLLNQAGQVILEPIFDWIFHEGENWYVGLNGRAYTVMLVDNPVILSDELLTKGAETPETDYLVSQGIIKGDNNGHLRLYDKVTRAEFVTMIARLENWDYDNSVCSFSDTVGHWAEKYISKAVEEGLVKGYDDATFAPEDKITVNEALLTMLRRLGLPEDFINENNLYILAHMAKIAPSGSYLLNEGATRECVVKILYNYIHTDMASDEIYESPPIEQEFYGK